VSLPQLLLVDDSEAVLAFGRAALSGHYQISTAMSGVDALQRMQKMKPAAVLLDLSMPQMDGDEVLAQMQKVPELRRIPVVILSSETKRAQACLRAGAAAFVAKPARAADLLAAIGKAIDDAEKIAKAGSLAVLPLEAGPHLLALPLECIVTVLAQVATRHLPLGPAYLCELFMLWGEPILVLDLPKRLGIAHAKKLEERQLVVVRAGTTRLALCVDVVHDPEELPPAAISSSEELGGTEHGLLREGLVAIAHGLRGVMPVLEPSSLASRALLAELASSLRATR
jgi:CheY-like chemotaxis protein/chemotaxis signal transduction protein